jgi:hypothetical protein
MPRPVAALTNTITRLRPLNYCHQRTRRSFDTSSLVVPVNRILVIRGGAIGDFILTLPAIKAVRNAYSDAVIDILGYPQIAVLAENRFYADAIRSIEHGPLSRFFAAGSELDPDLCQYFGSFDLIINYLFDPDETCL